MVHSPAFLFFNLSILSKRQFTIQVSIANFEQDIKRQGN